MVLQLAIKREYFEAIRAGTKKSEYRLDTPYWRSRLEGKTFDRIILTLGYAKRGDKERSIEFPWRGAQLQTIQHKHFGLYPVRVFAIELRH